jgi:N-acetylmuramoyl-L-alanine amidase
MIKLRDITELIIHCSDTPAGRADDVHDIDRWHKARGWSGCGYHYVICLDGTIQVGRDEAKIGANCKGHNSKSIGICYIGGKDVDTRTDAQKVSLVYLLGTLKRKYKGAVVYGHRDFSTKPCPQFNAKNEYKNI